MSPKLQLWVKGHKYESIIKSSVPINLKEIDSLLLSLFSVFAGWYNLQERYPAGTIIPYFSSV